MSGITQSEKLDALNTTLNTSYTDGFNRYTPIWSQFAVKIPFTSTRLSLSWMAELPRIREWIGARTVNGIKLNDFGADAREFEGTVGVKKAEIKDSNFVRPINIARGLGAAAAEFPDDLVFEVLNQALNLDCYDGQKFASKTHTKKVGTFSNLDDSGTGAYRVYVKDNGPLPAVVLGEREQFQFGSLGDGSEYAFINGEVLWGVDGRYVALPGVPQLVYFSNTELTVENVEADLAAIAAIRGYEDNVIDTRPTKVLVPQSEESKAIAVFGMQFNAAGASNPMYNRVQVVVCPKLDVQAAA